MKFQPTMKLLFVALASIGFLSTVCYGQYMDYYNNGLFPDYGGFDFPGIPSIPKEDISKMFLRNFADTAKGQVGSTDYLRNSKNRKYRIGKGKDKCHLFVADVLEASDAVAPQKHAFFSMVRKTPIDAKQWQKSHSMFVVMSGHFKRCRGGKNPGDIIAYKNHVGIVTGIRKTTMADPEANPRGLITETDWGFRRGQRPTCWRYT